MYVRPSQSKSVGVIHLFSVKADPFIPIVMDVMQLRDNYQCQYCGRCPTSLKDLSLDHVSLNPFRFVQFLISSNRDIPSRHFLPYLIDHRDP